ncbi:hypothetical protein Hypma_012914 [Hypsizygus marmoreus]|uniref:Uncharacterized protein n=1 Tax=Hypsizygus marmoreus TaxID=39966 RepID=A0A369JN46_HYPMA|nr:hypothetical protein Hypma_012914 [Hypsizygus marmoreus]
MRGLGKRLLIINRVASDMEMHELDKISRRQSLTDIARAHNDPWYAVESTEPRVSIPQVSSEWREYESGDMESNFIIEALKHKLKNAMGFELWKVG